MSRLIIVSNRLPFSIERSEEETIVRQSSGGLVSAIKSYFENPGKQSHTYSDKVWVGSMEASEEDWNEAKERANFTSEFSIEPIFPDKEDYENYYNGFSNSTLWPIFHYFPSIADFKKEHFE